MQNPPLQLWFFYGQDCSICHDLWPKVKRLVEEKFPKLELRHLDAAEHRELAGQNRMLSVPGILFWVEGREYLRTNGFVRLNQLEDQIQKAYSSYYQ